MNGGPWDCCQLNASCRSNGFLKVFSKEPFNGINNSYASRDYFLGQLHGKLVSVDLQDDTQIIVDNTAFGQGD